MEMFKLECPSKTTILLAGLQVSGTTTKTFKKYKREALFVLHNKDKVVDFAHH